MDNPTQMAYLKFGYFEKKNTRATAMVHISAYDRHRQVLFTLNTLNVKENSCKYLELDADKRERIVAARVITNGARLCVNVKFLISIQCSIQ